MRILPVALALLLVATTLLAPGATAQIGPNAVCATNQATGASGISEPRYFCEARDSAGFVQFEQFEAGLVYLEETYPDFVDVRVIGESVMGLPLYFVEVTNELSPVERADKLQIGYSASIHANEAAGREGMVRVIEDLAAGIGPHGAALQPLLDQMIVNVWFPNPDSWATGDYFASGSISALHECERGVIPLIGGPSIGYCSGFDRENALGVDLNREFPNPGWIEPDHTPMSEPESQAVVNELRFSGNHTNLVAGADLHGMINSPNMIRMIIPNQDYDFRRMVLVVRQLETIRERVADDPAFREWTSVDEVVATAEGLDLPLCAEDPMDTGLLFSGCLAPSDVHGEPFLWGSRWDQIGYTDSGFTSDYLTLSPRSPTGGMGAIGGITEFAYSHVVPDNKYVAKLTEMHVAGVRQIVLTQMEMALNLESPILAGTGPVAYAWTESWVTSDRDPNAYRAPNGNAFDLDDAEGRFDFNQVPYKVSNLNFWRDLGRFSEDPIEPLDAGKISGAALADYAHFAITDQALDGLSDKQVADVRSWVEGGGHLILTDGALQFLDRAGITSAAAQSLCVYVGHTNLETRDHALVDGVTWNARVTGESSATGFKANSGQDWNYPQWGIERGAFEAAGGEVVGTTSGHDGTSSTCTNESTDPIVTMGRLPVGSGSIDILGGALPQPTQAYDHRYGLADYSVSALTYWFVANSLGGEIAWEQLESPFVPTYDFDPLYGQPDTGSEQEESAATPAAPLVLIALAVVAVAVIRRRAT